MGISARKFVSHVNYSADGDEKSGDGEEKSGDGEGTVGAPPPPKHTPADEKAIEKIEKRKRSKLEKYEELLKACSIIVILLQSNIPLLRY